MIRVSESSDSFTDSDDSSHQLIRLDKNSDSMPRKSWLGDSWVINWIIESSDLCDILLTRVIESADLFKILMTQVIESDSWLEMTRESSCHSNDSWQALEITTLSLLRKFSRKHAWFRDYFLSFSDEHIFTIEAFWNAQINWMT